MEPHSRAHDFLARPTRQAPPTPSSLSRRSTLSLPPTSPSRAESTLPALWNRPPWPELARRFCCVRSWHARLACPRRVAWARPGARPARPAAMALVARSLARGAAQLAAAWRPGAHAVPSVQPSAARGARGVAHSARHGPALCAASWRGLRLAQSARRALRDSPVPCTTRHRALRGRPVRPVRLWPGRSWPPWPSRHHRSLHRSLRQKFVVFYVHAPTSCVCAPPFVVV
jgi:hypothetical protein